MTEWWSSLSGAEHIFYVIAISASFILLLQLLLNLIGLAGHDTDLGVPVGTEIPHDVAMESIGTEAHSTGLSLISVRTIVAFFVGFGWAGVVMLKTSAPFAITLIAALVVGLIFLFTVFYLMRTIFSLSETGNIDAKNAVGQTGTVYLPVPPRHQGAGQVQVVVQGRMREFPAVTDGEEALPSGTPVQVAQVLAGTTMVVRKLEVK